MIYQPQMNINTNEEGQGLVEYALILVLVAIVVIAALSLLGTEINGIFGEIGETLQNR
jgi:pilus assembly protein Flp/PilA